MKQTAVDYIKEKLMCDEYWYENMTFEQIFKKAKEMEKEQIIEAYETSHISMMTSKQYYNETYKNTEE